MTDTTRFAGRSMFLVDQAEKFAAANGLAWRSISCDFAARTVTIHGQRYEVLHTMQAGQ